MTDRRSHHRAQALSLEQRRRLEASLLQTRGHSPIEARPIEARPSGPAPASREQRHLWIVQQMDLSAPTYNSVRAVELCGPLDVRALDAALSDVVARHEVLRTAFELRGDSLVQIVRPSCPHLMPMIDATQRGTLDARTIVEVCAAPLWRRAFDLGTAPLMRAVLIACGPRRHVLAIVGHHIVFDAASFDITARDLAACYAARRAGRPPQLPALARQYADHARSRESARDDENRERQARYWQAKLANCPPPITGDGELHAPVGPGDTQCTPLPIELSARIRQAAAAAGVTVFAVHALAIAVLIARVFGKSDVVLGLPMSTRTEESDGLIGYFVNVVALRMHVARGARVQQLLREAATTAAEALSNSDVPFETVVASTPGLRGAGRVFDAVIGLHQASSDALRLDGLSLSHVHVRSGITRFPLEFSIEEIDGKDEITLVYERQRFDRAFAARLRAMFERILDAITTRPHATVAELPLLDEEERTHLVQTCNATARTWDGPDDVVQALEAQVRRTPKAVALVADDGVWTYEALNARANQLARALRAAGARRETRVAVCVARSGHAVLALWGIWKAGAVYVPVEVSYPSERVAFMLKDAGTRIVLADVVGAAMIAAAVGEVGDAPNVVPLVVRVDEERFEATHDLGLAVAPLQAAYAIYTSGSTGRPKGAVNTHAGLRNRLAWMQAAFPLSSADAVLHKTPCSFDVSMWELVWPLMFGARQVVCRTEGHRDPAYLIDLMRQQAVTTVHFVPSMLQVFLQAADVERCAALRQVICSGEALWPAVAAECQARLPGAALHNLYGPTEASIDVTSWTCPSGWQGSQVPIGRPIANTQTYVLDASGALAPRGVAGELYLGGVNLARGYLDRPGLTAARFVPDAFGGEPGARLYRTGDRVRWNAAGELEYLGRLDHQIKLRGHRIELGEIEAALTALDAVRQSVVVVREATAATPQLVAYVVRDADAPAQDAEAAGADATLESWSETVRARLAARLPAYMVPAVIVPLAALPLTPNGKVDRRALPAPSAPSHAAVMVTPTTPREAQLAAIWAHVLNQPAVSIDANFFALGGDSILAIQLVARAAQAGLRLTPRQVFDYPTVRGLAAAAQLIDPGPVVAGPDASFALTPIQAAFVTTPRVARDYYNQAVLLTVAPGVAGRSLRRALQALAAHHGLLRARFVQDEAGWRGAIAPAARTPGEALCVVALERVSAAAVGRVQARVCAQWQRSLCLATGPVWRAGLVTRADGARRLLLVAHHLIVDGVSWRILLEDLQQAVAQVERGMAVHLPPASSSFAQWSAAVQTAASQWPVAAEQSWWRATAAAPVAPLPCDAPPTAAAAPWPGTVANRVSTARTVTVSLSAAATTRVVQRRGPGAGSGTEAVLLTAVAGAIGRWSGAPTVRVALEGHGREELPGVDVSRTVGWFTTIYPVTLPATGASVARLRAVTEQLAAVPRRGFGYGLLRTHVADAAVRAERLADVAPEIIVNYLGQFDAVWAAARLIRPSTEPAGASQGPREPRPFVLDIIGEVRDGMLRLRWTYCTALHTRETIDALAHECLREIEQLLDAPVLSDDARPEPPHAGTAALSSLLDTETVARALAQVEF